MDATQGRQQTTLGIWMDSAVTTERVVVMVRLRFDLCILFSGFLTALPFFFLRRMWKVPTVVKEEKTERPSNAKLVCLLWRWPRSSSSICGNPILVLPFLIFFLHLVCRLMLSALSSFSSGRYTASNYGILKTIFEVNLQLFKATKSVFVLCFSSFSPSLFIPFLLSCRSAKWL
jgi:hypothetical protein